MDKIQLSSTELLGNLTEQATMSKLEAEAINLIREYPIETFVGAAAVLGATTGLIYKLAAREAAQIAAAKIETEGLQVGGEALMNNDFVGRMIKLGARDAGKITEARVGDRLDVMVPFGERMPYPGFVTDQKGVLRLLQAGYGPERSKTVRAMYEVTAPGEDAIHIILPGKHFDFAVKAS